MDDSTICWPHDSNKLEEFHLHLSNIAPCISLTKELESNNQLPFLDILLTRNPNGSLAFQVFRKAAHIALYPRVSSHHHLHQKLGILKTLFTKAFKISDNDYRDQEIAHLVEVFKLNGYKREHSLKAIKQAKSNVAFIPKEPFPSNIPPSLKASLTFNIKNSSKRWPLFHLPAHSYS